MKAHLIMILFSEVTVMLILSCKQAYNPPAIKSNPGYLVVDGVLHIGQDSTVITLSRTRNLDSIIPIPELQAQVMVVGESSDVYPLQEQGNGKYVTDHLNLAYNKNYQLKIITADSREYLSDTFPAKQTPPIDSVTWRQDSVGVHIYVNTNDPQNNTRYYRWDYDETWQYHTAYETFFDYVNGQIIQRPTDQLIYTCWQSDHSTDIQIASSIKLANDIIYENPISVIPNGDEKLSVKYSILVKQYAVTPTSYDYWQNLKKNTQQLGTLFDPQPSEIIGNMHAVNNPNEPVLGFIGACNVQQKRIFISNLDLPNGWNYFPYYSECALNTVMRSQLDSLLPSTGPRFFVFVGQNLTLYLTTSIRCGDCRNHGGVNNQPAFWQ